MVCGVRAQAPEDNVKTFFDSNMPGIAIQFNATAQTNDMENLTVWLQMTPQSNVYVDSFNLEVYGFINGTTRTSIGNINGRNLSNGTSSLYSRQFQVPEGVSGVTFTEITLNYNIISRISLGSINLSFPNATTGFYMTLVKNTYLESLRSQLQSLNESYAQLNETYANLTNTYLQLNQTFLQLQQNYTSLQNNVGELDNTMGSTRQVAAILAITTVFFVATTVFMVMRRPAREW